VFDYDVNNLLKRALNFGDNFHTKVPHNKKPQAKRVSAYAFLSGRNVKHHEEAVNKRTIQIGVLNGGTSSKLFEVLHETEVS
jgi:Na+-transporting NADH:ubiquinone oxidoreductase subunit NqrA